VTHEQVLLSAVRALDAEPCPDWLNCSPEEPMGKLVRVACRSARLLLDGPFILPAMAADTDHPRKAGPTTGDTNHRIAAQNTHDKLSGPDRHHHRPVLSLLGRSDAVLGLLGGLERVEHLDLVAVGGEELVQAEPVVSGGFHADEDFGRSAGIGQPGQQELKARRGVVERFWLGDGLAIPVDDAGDVSVFGHVNAAEQ
jgi:hypothetical protein